MAYARISDKTQASDILPLLIGAASSGDVQGVELGLQKALQAGLDVGFVCRARLDGALSAVDAAMEKDHADCLRALLENGLSLGGSGLDPLIVDCARRSALKCCDLLLALGAEPDAKPVQSRMPGPLAIAAGKGNLEMCKALVEAGASVDKQGIDGKRALLSACLNGRESCAMFLIEAGSDVSLADSAGLSPLMGAAQSGMWRVVERLAAAGAPIDSLNADGLRAIDYASAKKDGSCLEALLRAGASPEPVLGSESFPMKHALASGSLAGMRLLSQAGASALWCSDGCCSLSLALGPQASPASGVVEFLVSEGADPLWAQGRPASLGMGLSSYAEALFSRPFDESCLSKASAMDLDGQVLAMLCSLEARGLAFRDELQAALTSAAKAGAAKSAAVLLARGADPFVGLNGSRSPFEIACCGGRPNSVELISPMLASLDGGWAHFGKKHWLLKAASLVADARCGSASVFEWLDSECSKFGEAFRSKALGRSLEAAGRNSNSMVFMSAVSKMSLSGHKDLAGGAALAWAAEGPRLDSKCFKAALDGCSSSGLARFGQQALASVAGWGSVEQAKLLLERGVKPSGAKRKDGVGIVEVASESRRLPVLNLLLDYGLQLADGWRASDLAMVAYCGNPPLLRKAIGAAASRRSSRGRLASFSRERFLRLGLWFQTVDESWDSWEPRWIGGSSEASLAARSGSLECVELLLDEGFDFKRPDAMGRTPLMWAARLGNFSICDRLLIAGAEPSGTDFRGEDCLALAKRSGRVQVVELFSCLGERRSIEASCLEPCGTSLPAPSKRRL